MTRRWSIPRVYTFLGFARMVRIVLCRGLQKRISALSNCSHSSSLSSTLISFSLGRVWGLDLSLSVFFS